ncbi:hypothetical protein QJR26_04320 [Clostridium baratii]
MGNIKEKLRKIKKLAEKGTEGEKSVAIKMYEEMKKKYGVDDVEIDKEEIKRRWFRYKDNLEMRLLTQIFYMITGSVETWVKVDKRYKVVGVECTEFEKEEIEFYFEYYREHLLKELDDFMTAFCSVNDLYPTENARCYTKPKESFKTNNKNMKIGFMASGMDVTPRPVKRLT